MRASNIVNVGDVYGRGTVLELIRLPPTAGQARRGWNGNLGALLLCACGNTFQTARYNLTSGNTRSCGCLLRRSTNIVVGRRFGRGVITALERMPPNKRQRARGHVGSPGAVLTCDCGNTYRVVLDNLVSGNTRSCGCLDREVSTARILSSGHRTHGMSGHPLFSTWHGMVARCHDPNHPAYVHYGRRGITVDPAWHDPAAFIADIERSLGPRPTDHSLDRIDNDRGYQPGNVRWATRWTQARNRRPSAASRLRDLEEALRRLGLPTCARELAEAELDRSTGTIEHA